MTLDFGPNIGPPSSDRENPFSPSNRFSPNYYRGLDYTYDDYGNANEHGAYQRQGRDRPLRRQGLLTKKPGESLNATSSPAIGLLQLDPTLSRVSVGRGNEDDIQSTDLTPGYEPDQNMKGTLSNWGMAGKTAFSTITSAIPGPGPTFNPLGSLISAQDPNFPDLSIYGLARSLGHAMGFGGGDEEGPGALGWDQPGNIEDEMSNAGAYGDISGPGSDNNSEPGIDPSFGYEDISESDVAGQGGDYSSSDPAGSDASGDAGADDSVICNELYRQGRMPYHVWRADQDFAGTLDVATIYGYHLWARPVVWLMRRSSRFSAMVEPVAMRWARHMAYRMGVLAEDDRIGRAMLRYLAPACRFIGRVRHRIYLLPPCIPSLKGQTR